MTRFLDDGIRKTYVTTYVDGVGLMDDLTESEGRLTRHGNSTGLVLSREVLDAAGMERGDGVKIRAEPGKVTVEKADTVHSRAMDAYREFAARFRVALRALAK